jgi:hypothetical protein
MSIVVPGAINSRQERTRRINSFLDLQGCSTGYNGS